MQFVTRKRRQTPAVIIVSLIDVLIVVLIFMMATTTFKKPQPAVKLALPESKQAREGTSEKPPLIITVAKQEPFFFVGNRPVTLEKLQGELQDLGTKNAEAVLFIRADQDAPFGKIVNVMDAAKAAKIHQVSAFTRSAGK